MPLKLERTLRQLLGFSIVGIVLTEALQQEFRMEQSHLQIVYVKKVIQLGNLRGVLKIRFFETLD